MNPIDESEEVQRFINHYGSDKCLCGVVEDKEVDDNCHEIHSLRIEETEEKRVHLLKIPRSRHIPGVALSKGDRVYFCFEKEKKIEEDGYTGRLEAVINTATKKSYSNKVF